MPIEAKKIQDVFTGSRILEIPFFQRAYVWDEEQWERLLEDVKDVSQNDKPYFVGALILKQQQTRTLNICGDRRTVIDGQQRLTTLCILLKVLCLKTDQMTRFDKRFRMDDGTFALVHNHNDEMAFAKIMNLTKEEDFVAEEDDRVTKAYRFFKERLDPNTVKYDAIMNGILFVLIDLSAEEDEQQIFDTINSLGVKLTVAELLKNYFFSRDNRDQYELYWKKTFEQDKETRKYWDQGVTTGRNKRSVIDVFFHAYLQIKVNSSSVPIEGKDQFSRIDNLFASYKRFDKKDKLSLGDINDYAKSFKKMFDPEIVGKILPANPGIERINAIIFGLETTTLIPYVLFIEKNVEDVATKNDLYDIIEAFVMRRIIDNASTKNYNQFFTDRLIHNKVLSRRAFVDYLKKQDNKANDCPDDDRLKDAVKTRVLTNTKARGVLYFMESRIRSSEKQSTQLLGLEKYSLEHVMPKKWQNRWAKLNTKQEIDNRNEKLQTLGNLTIITQPLNSSMRDADWKTKQKELTMYSYGIETFSDYLTREEWNETVIDERAEFLYKKALEVWGI